MQNEIELLTNFQETLMDYFPLPSEEEEDTKSENSNNISTDGPIIYQNFSSSSTQSNGSSASSGSSGSDGGGDCCGTFLVIVALVCSLFCGIYVLAKDEYVNLLCSRLNRKVKRLSRFDCTSKHFLEVRTTIRLYKDWKNKFLTRTQPLFLSKFTTFVSFVFSLVNFWINQFQFGLLVYIGIIAFTIGGCSWIWMNTAKKRSENRKLRALYNHLQQVSL